MTQRFVFTLLFFFLTTSTAFADAGWKITNFSSIIGVQSDGYVRVREIIHADFGPLERHGIFRDIPIGYVTSDGKSIAIEAKVGSVTDGVKPIPYESSNTNGNLRLKIGDANTLVSGQKAYIIDYTMRGVLREFEKYDELYWNVTGDQWSVPIEHTEVTFALPKNGIVQWACYFGARGSAENCGGEKISESMLRFMTQKTLQNGQGMTIAVGFTKGIVPILPPLAEDSSASTAQKTSPLAVMLSFLITFGLGIFFLTMLWWRKGRDLQTNGTVVTPFKHETIIAEYVPPQSLRPGELGVIMDETADTLDVTATIIDLAVRGFLTIEEIPKNWFLGSTDYKLTKTNTDDTALLNYEKKLLIALFKERPSATFSEFFQALKGEEPPVNDPTKKTVEISELKNTFYKDLKEVKELLYENVSEKKLFFENPSTARLKYKAVGIPILIIGVILNFLSNFSSIFPGIGWALLLLAILIFILPGKIASRRTALGHEAYLKTKGYKLFISQTETYRQQFFEKENTFMEVLPYAIVFGVTTKLASAMKEMGVNPPAPSWYQGVNTFNAAVFAGNMGDFSKSLSGAMASAPSGSGSGGGGFSGGGFGGGGGGSW